MSRKSNLAEVVVLLKRDITALECALDRSRREEKYWVEGARQRDQHILSLQQKLSELEARLTTSASQLEYQIGEKERYKSLCSTADNTLYRERAAWLSERTELESRVKHAEVMLGVAQQRNAELHGAPAAGAPEGLFGQFIAFAARVTGLTEEVMWKKVATHMQLALLGTVVDRGKWYVEPGGITKEREIKPNENK